MKLALLRGIEIGDTQRCAFSAIFVLAITDSSLALPGIDERYGVSVHSEEINRGVIPPLIYTWDRLRLTSC